MLVTNQRLDKLAAARVNFVSRGMLDPSKKTQPPGMVSAPTVGREGGVEGEEEEDKQPAAGPSTGTAQVAMVMGNVILAQTRSTSLCIFICLLFH